MMKHISRFAVLTAMLAAGAAAWSQSSIPATAPYYTDPQNEYVQDQTSDGIANLNMVLCIMNGMNAASQVNAGPYVALVDKNKCDTKSRSSASNSTGGASGATSATDYINAVVDVTQASNADPMYAKIWMTLTENGHVTTVYAYLSATQAPSATLPYGAFHLDYLGKVGGATQFNGFIDVGASSPLQYLENDTNGGQSPSQTALALSASSSTTSGNGSMALTGGATFDFAFDASSFERRDASSSVQCFDRSKANASASVWSYGTYNRNDGTRVDVAHPGFPVTATYGSNSYYGFAGYWGINFQGLDLNSIPDAQPIPGLTVTDQRPNTSATYSLSKVSGKLTMYTQVPSTLGALDGIPFSFGGDLTNQTTGNSSVAGWNNWVMQWNHVGQNFTVIGVQNCGNNGCVVSNLSPVATVNAGAFANMPINGWSNSFGGNLMIPPTAAAHADSDVVYYYTQSTVVPGSAGAPSSLHCMNQCLTAASVGAFTGAPNQSPYDSSTSNQWFSGTTAVAYTFGATGLVNGSTAMLLPPGTLGSNNPQFQNGVMTGNLYDDAVWNGGNNCPNGMGLPQGSMCQPANPSVYYQWQTGPNQWDQSLWLTPTGGGSAASFDPPQNIAYTVPTGAAYGTWAGKSILLQFDGFGNLFGIPGYCVSPVDNSVVDCSTPNSRYVPMFSIPDGDVTMTLPGSTATPLIVKALNAELRLKKLALSDAACTVAGTTLQSLSVPTTGTHDPSNPADSHYLGQEPTPASSNPKVIDGVVQP
jgi:hypothetical protein